MTSWPTNWVNWVTTFIDRWQLFTLRTRRQLDVELSWVELSCIAINGPLNITSAQRCVGTFSKWHIAILPLGHGRPAISQRTHCRFCAVVDETIEWHENEQPHPHPIPILSSSPPIPDCFYCDAKLVLGCNIVLLIMVCNTTHPLRCHDRPGSKCLG